jgi:hypothetical protein
MYGGEESAGKKSPARTLGKLIELIVPPMFWKISHRMMTVRCPAGGMATSVNLNGWMWVQGNPKF